MNDNNVFDMDHKNEINELLEMFDFEPISDNDSQKIDKKNEIRDETGANTKNIHNTEEIIKSGKNGVVKFMIAFALVSITIMATLFLTEQNSQNKFGDVQIASLEQEATEKIENKASVTKSSKSVSSEITVKVIEREFKEDPSMFVSYYGNINYYDMTLLLEEDELIAVAPKLNNVFLMSEPKANSKQMVNMYIKDTDFAGVVGIYGNYLHVYFPIDDYEYYGWVRKADVEFYSVDEYNNLDYMTADEFNDYIIREKQAGNVETAKDNQPTENQGSASSTISSTKNDVSNASTTANYFTIGSLKEQVLAVMGNPSSVNDYTYFETWSYGINTIEFVNGKVTGYLDYENTLKVWLGDRVSNTFFSINSSKEDVLKANGTPTGIANYTYFETWSFGINTVEFSGNKVNGYHDYDNILNVNLGSAIAGKTFGIGSSKQDVINANGTPTGIGDYTYSESWSYGISNVVFNSNGIVESYNNWDGNLKISF